MNGRPVSASMNTVIRDVWTLNSDVVGAKLFLANKIVTVSDLTWGMLGVGEVTNNEWELVEYSTPVNVSSHYLQRSGFLGVYNFKSMSKFNIAIATQGTKSHADNACSVNAHLVIEFSSKYETDTVISSIIKAGYAACTACASQTKARVSAPPRSSLSAKVRAGGFPMEWSLVYREGRGKDIHLLQPTWGIP